MSNIRRNEWFPGFLDMFFTDETMPAYKRVSPSMNILESEDEYIVEIAALGLTKSDFTIQVNEDNILTVSMEKTQEKSSKKEPEEGVAVPQPKSVRYLRREFSTQSFEQKLVLPEDVLVEEISAKMENGVLSINVPKRKPEQKVTKHHRIEVQ